MINKLVNFISSTQSTIYDTESLTILESIGKIIEKVNLCIQEFNNLEVKNKEDYDILLNVVKEYKAYCRNLIENYHDEVMEQIEDFKKLINLLNNIESVVQYVKEQSTYIQELAKQNQDKIDRADIVSKAELNEVKNEIGWVSVKNYGAYGNGVTDDTKAFKDALATGKNVYIPEGIYLISETLYVNVEKQYLRGESSLSILQENDTFTGKTMVVFYSPNGDYNSRYKRIKRHGNFSIIGIKSKKDIDGIQTSGEYGTSYEGHCDQQVYENIFIAYCNNRILYSPHTYKCTFINVQGHENNYDLKSSDTHIDSGEVLLFLNCTFWGGKVDIKKKAQFLSCTFHPQFIDDSIDASIVFRNEYFSLTNCHFEVLSSKGIDKTSFDRIFLSDNAQVDFLNCDATINDGVTLTDYCFKTQGDINSFIRVKGGNWRYFFTRLKPLENAYLCKGNVQIDGCFTPQLNTSYHMTQIYDNTTSFTQKEFNGEYNFIQLGGIKNSDLTITQLDKGINVSGTKDYQISYCGLMKCIPCKYQGGGIYKAKIILKNQGSIYRYKIKKGDSELYSIGFLDKNKNIINITENVDTNITYDEVDKVYEITQIFGIPFNAEYILYGIGYQHGGVDLYNIDIIECKIELW